MNTSNKLTRRDFVKGSGLVGAGLLASPAGNLTPASYAAKEASRADGAPQVLIERVEKVHSDGQWNGRPAIVFWQGRYYLFFRAGSAHDSADGRIRLLKSRPNQPDGWVASTIIDTPHNEAEVHVLATHQRLFAYIVQESDEGEPVGSMVSHSDSGTDWSKLERAYDPKFSFWKPVTHKGTHYVASDVMTGRRRVELLSSHDGLKWQKVSIIAEGRYTETALVFLADATLVAVIRQGRIAVSRPPYAQWSLYEGVDLGGPAAQLVGNTVLVAGRTSVNRHPDHQPGGSRTGLFMFDSATQTLNWQLNLLTQWGGDVAYADFLALGNQRALIAWYDGEAYEKGVPKQADILLATLRVQ